MTVRRGGRHMDGTNRASRREVQEHALEIIRDRRPGREPIREPHLLSRLSAAGYDRETARRALQRLVVDGRITIDGDRYRAR
jgi:hypothetical protein